MPVFQAILYQPMVVSVRQSKKANARQKGLQQQTKCLCCEEPLKTDGLNRRGLCPSCYMAARRAMAAGKTSEAELMRKGLLAKPLKGGRPPKNPLTKRVSGGTL